MPRPATQQRLASRFNPSPVCGTGEICLDGAAAVTEVFQSVSGLWDRRNLLSPPEPPCLTKFQSVSGLWDRRNQALGGGLGQDRRFNPSPVCGTGEIIFRSREMSGALVSIRLRSVGPEKCPPGRLRPIAAGGFNPSPVCGTGEIGLPGTELMEWEFQSVSGLWDRRNRRRARAFACTASFNPSPVCGTGEIGVSRLPKVR